MAGLCGLTVGNCLEGSLKACIQAMQNSAVVNTALVKDEIYVDANVAGSRVTSHWQLTQTPAFVPGSPQDREATQTLAVWFDGELYDAGNLPERLENVSPRQFTIQSPSELLARTYVQTGDFSFLRELDGKFCAVIYDLSQNQVHLVSDRYGMCPLHWTVLNGSLIWSGNIRALTCIPGWTTKIDPASVEDFLGMRYLMSDRTWFEGVELLSAATVLTWNLNNKTLHRYRYWKWNDIKPLPSNINIQEVAEEAGRLFVAGVQRQYQAGGKSFLTLSGGLDSRAIFAALPIVNDPLLAITFGKQGDGEIEIATQIARKKASKHCFIEAELSNWLIPQALETLITECLVPINQLTFQPTLPLLQTLDYQANFHGAGAACCKHLFKPDYLPKYLCRHLWLDALARSTTHHQSVSERFYAYYEYLDSSYHQLYIDHRIRRFSAKDFNLYKLLGIQTRLPFLDNRFQEFLYALPSEFLLKPNNEFYSWLLLQTFPDFYRGLPPYVAKNIDPGNPRVLWDKAKDKFARKLPFLKSLQTSKPKKTSPFHQEPNRSFFGRLFTASSPYFAEFLDPAIVRQDWEAHLGGDRNELRLYDVAALELWLRSLDLGTGQIPL